MSTADGLNGVGNSIGQVGIILWGGLLFFHHQLDLGGWLVASNFASSIFDELWDVIDSITQIKATKDLRTELHTLTQDTETDTEEDASPVAISVKGLVITYEGHQIRYPDFTIKACDKVLLSGDSGTGKSTLLKAILGKLQPTAGSIEYYDEKEELIIPNYRQIGYVAQDGVLFPDTIANNVTMFQHYPESQLNKVIDSVELTNDLAKFPQGVNTTINLDNLNVSGGQQQKIISSQKLENANVKETGIKQYLKFVNEISSQVMLLLLYAVTGYLIIAKQIAFGVISVVSDLKYYLTSGIEMIIEARGAMIGVTNLNRQIEDLIIPFIKQEEPSVGLEEVDEIITADLQMAFPNGESLQLPDIKVKPGQKILLTGESGVGKSTFCHYKN